MLRVVFLHALISHRHYWSCSVLERVDLNESLDGIDIFAKGERITDIFSQIPGLSERSWTPQTVSLDQRLGSDRERSALTKALIVIWGKVMCVSLCVRLVHF